MKTNRTSSAGDSIREGRSGLKRHGRLPVRHARCVRLVGRPVQILAPLLFATVWACQQTDQQDGARATASRAGGVPVAFLVASAKPGFPHAPSQSWYEGTDSDTVFVVAPAPSDGSREWTVVLDGTFLEWEWDDLGRGWRVGDHVVRMDSTRVDSRALRSIDDTLVVLRSLVPEDLQRRWAAEAAFPRSETLAEVKVRVTTPDGEAGDGVLSVGMGEPWDRNELPMFQCPSDGPETGPTRPVADDDLPPPPGRVGTRVLAVDLALFSRSDTVVFLNDDGTEWLRVPLYGEEPIDRAIHDRLHPLAYDERYGDLMLEIVGETPAGYDVIVDSDLGLKKRVRHEDYFTVLSWLEWLRTHSLVDPWYPKDTLGVAPSDTAAVVLVTPDAPRYEYSPVEYRGEWLRVRWREEEGPRCAWVRWWRDGRFVVAFLTMG